MINVKTLGAQGEKYAQDWLRKRNFKILEVNIHCQVGEIDILAYDKSEKIVVAFEVKTRTVNGYGDGSESITPAKIKKIEKTLIYYFLKNYRFKKIPEYEIRALVLKLRSKNKSHEPVFEVDYYHDLS